MTVKYILSVTETEVEEGRFFNLRLSDERGNTSYVNALPYEKFIGEIKEGEHVIVEYAQSGRPRTITNASGETIYSDAALSLT